MSEALYKNIGGLRFWTEEEINLRESYVSLVSRGVQRKLQEMNPAFVCQRVEGPILTPASFISPEYGDDDFFHTTHKKGGETLCLRAETTASSYQFANRLGLKKPFCVWQFGKSFRTETNDGASANKLRFNEFYQLEFQCIYRRDTRNDYRIGLMDEVCHLSRMFVGDSRIVESDRQPSYSESTLDIEALHNNNWKEIASCSIRNDYSGDDYVCEIAIGVDRVVSISGARYG